MAKSTQSVLKPRSIVPINVGMLYLVNAILGEQTVMGLKKETLLGTNILLKFLVEIAYNFSSQEKAEISIVPASVPVPSKWLLPSLARNQWQLV